MAGLKPCEPHHISDTDAALMLAFQEGDEEAFVTLYRRYRDKLFNFARRLLRDPAVAEEATQEVLLKVYRARATYQPRSRFSTFVFRIATNHCLNLLARKEHKVVAKGELVDTADSAATPEERAQAGEVRAAVTSALASLPEKQATALLLSHYEGLSHQEVGEVLGVTVSAVKSLVFRARESMMKKLSTQMAREGETNHAL